MGSGARKIREKGKSRMKEPENVCEMALCEVEHLFLRPDQLYRFVVMEGCDRCKKLAEVYETVTNDWKQRD